LAKHNPNQSLADIHANIKAARSYLDGISRDEFRTNDEKQQAVLHRLQTASEAATRLRNEWPERYEQFAAAHPEVSWANFRRLGDRYRHGYDIIDLDLVWSDLNGYLGDVERAIECELALLDVP
jgi:uncharacterized protein with HEPN domain